VPAAAFGQRYRCFVCERRELRPGLCRISQLRAAERAHLLAASWARGAPRRCAPLCATSRRGSAKIDW